MERGTYDLISIYEINFSLFRNIIPRSTRKNLYILAEYTQDDIQGLLTYATEVSHRYNWRWCINPTHLYTESHTTNLSRTTCFRQGADFLAVGMAITPYYTVHDPLCLLQQAALLATSKMTREWELVGKPLPVTLPSQTKSKGSGLLTKPIRHYKWIDSKPIVVREFNIQSTNTLFPGVEVPSII